MVKLRLQRFGSKKRPFYRIVAADIKALRRKVLKYYWDIESPRV